MRRSGGEILEQLKRSGVILCKDLGLFASLYIAHFIVWRVLRSRRKANAFRRKNFKLIRGEGLSAGLANGMTFAISEGREAAGGVGQRY